MDQWRKYAFLRGISQGEDRARRKAFQSAKEKLIAEGMAGEWNETVWLVPS